jgi:hypothetical protein
MPATAISERHRRHLASLPDRYIPARALGVGLLGASLLLPIRAIGASGPDPSQLKPAARQAFERYTQLTDARNQDELRAAKNLLWIDALPEAQRNEGYVSLRNGQVKMQKFQASDNDKTVSCPGCLIHHWIGVIFISGANVDDVLGVLEDYDRHATYFAPDVERSKTLSRDGDHFRVFLRFRRHKVITVVLNTEHDVHYFRDAPERAHSRSSATRIAEVENAGKNGEKEKTPGDDGGFLWGMETWWRMEERDGGVYVQSEVASLTRDIPTGLGWLVGPFVNGIPKETLTFTLEATRKAVQTKMPHR